MLEAKFGDDLHFDVVVIKNCIRSQIAVNRGLVSSNFKLIVCKTHCDMKRLFGAIS